MREFKIQNNNDNQNEDTNDGIKNKTEHFRTHSIEYCSTI